MIDRLTSNLDFNGKALTLRADRQRILASNIANVDTPGYVARDFDFGAVLREATENGGKSSQTTDPNHIGVSSTLSDSATTLGYARASQPSIDGNSVDLDRERAAFADNSIRYEATLRFINGQVKTMLAAIQGQ